MSNVELLEKVRRYKKLKQVQKEAEEQAKKFSDEIIAAIQSQLKESGEKKLVLDVFTLSISVMPNPRFNKETFSQDYGEELYNKYIVHNPFQRLNIR